MASQLTPLPSHLLSSVRINWHISSWCNYSCQYCPVMVFHQRSRSGERQAHAFDYHPVGEWLGAIRKFDFQKVHLKISGGEPFLDRNRFRELLIGLSEMDHVRVGVDTNGYWDPAYFKDVDKSRMWVNVAFHPTQRPLEEFLPNLLKIRDAGFSIPIVNYVLAPENLDQFDSVMWKFEREGFFVNVSTMIPTGVYLSRTGRTERELNIVEKYNTPLDNHFKIVKPATKGRPCFYPAMTYYMMYDGTIRVACLDSTVRDLFTEEIPALPRTAVACEYQECIGCSDMYRALEDEPRITRPLELFTLEEYAEEVQEFRRRRAWNEKVERIPLVSKLLRHDLETAAFRGEFFKIKEIAPAVPLQDNPQPLPDGAAFGRADQGEVEARSGDRISLSGWAAGRAASDTPWEVRLVLAGQPIGAVRDFFYRTDIARVFGRPEMAKCGWRIMVYLPRLSRGEHDLVPMAVDAQGNETALAPIKIRIVD